VGKVEAALGKVEEECVSLEEENSDRTTDCNETKGAMVSTQRNELAVKSQKNRQLSGGSDITVKPL